MAKGKLTFVISAVNIFEGGALSVLEDCLSSIEKSNCFPQFTFIALVHNKNRLPKYKRIKLIEIPDARKSYAHRLYFEYKFFKKIAKKFYASFWFSLHDITPNVGEINQAVYCHNPSPFYRPRIKDIVFQPKQIFFSLFYFLIYRINLYRNKYVIVQQNWIATEFCKRFNVTEDKIIVAKPYFIKVKLNDRSKSNKGVIRFFYPTYPRVFKNVEVICAAVSRLQTLNIGKFEVLITMDGSENFYSKNIYRRFKHISNIKFIGLQSRENVYKLYDESNFLIFPSKMETWGMPLSEFKEFNKPIIVADLPYARETLEGFQKIFLFPPNNSKYLAEIIQNCIVNPQSTNFDILAELDANYRETNSWEELIKTLCIDL